MLLNFKSVTFTFEWATFTFERVFLIQKCGQVREDLVCAVGASVILGYAGASAVNDV